MKFFIRTIQCEDSSNPEKDVLRIIFVIEYPQGCGTISCQQRITNEFKTNIRHFSPLNNISIDLSNNQFVSTYLDFCSFDQILISTTTTMATLSCTFIFSFIF